MHMHRNLIFTNMISSREGSAKMANDGFSPVVGLGCYSLGCNWYSMSQQELVVVPKWTVAGAVIYNQLIF